MKKIAAKSILSGYKEENSWFGSNYNMNLYKGCNHGCIYCDSRSDCYRIENFDEVRAKENALGLLERELKGKRKKGIIGMGAMSDPYNPFEQELQLTRGALALIHRFGFGVTITTKGTLVERDMDLLKAISVHSPVLIKITITTAKDEVARKVEPHAPVSSRRFAAIQRLAEQGLFAGVLLMPVLPFIEDTEENVHQMVEMAHKHGAQFIYSAFGVTLRQNQREWYYQKLEQNFPTVKERYVKAYGNAYECRSLRAKELWQLFQQECRRGGLLYTMPEIIRAYTQPKESAEKQLSLFE